jgi:hypothetical protein
MLSQKMRSLKVLDSGRSMLYAFGASIEIPCLLVDTRSAKVIFNTCMRVAYTDYESVQAKQQLSEDTGRFPRAVV